MLYGYARVSTPTQNLKGQIERIKQEGVLKKNIITEIGSGKNFERNEFKRLVGCDTNPPLLRNGDLLVVTSVDRLGRDYKNLLKWWRYIVDELKCDIRCIDQSPMLDTSTVSEGDTMRQYIADSILQGLALAADIERKSLLERQRRGIEVAKSNGLYKGRKPLETPENFDRVVTEWHNKRITEKTAYTELGLSRSTFKRMAARYGYSV